MLPTEKTITPIQQTRMQKIARQLIHAFCRTLIFLLTRRNVTGQGNIPPHGPMLMVANHISMADQYFVAVNVKQRMMYMAKEEIFRHHPISLMVQAFGAFPVRRGGLNRRALEKAQAVLDNNLTLFTFPEGTRSRDGRLQRAYPGSALLALRNQGVPILPVAITGLEHVRKGPFWYLVRRHKVTVSIRFGRPFYLPKAIEQPTKEQLHETADLMMEHIARLLPPEYRGYYTDQVSDDNAPD
jgi:1-acyl-sn-glycerol-3-phosphate acyltransferase